MSGDLAKDFLDAVRARWRRLIAMDLREGPDLMRRAETLLQKFDLDEDSGKMPGLHHTDLSESVRMLMLIVDTLAAENLLLRLSIAKTGGVASGEVRRENVEHYWDDMVAWAQEELDRQTHATSGEVWRAIAERLTKKYGSKDDPPEDLLRSPATIRNRVKKDAPALYTEIVALKSGKRKR